MGSLTAALASLHHDSSAFDALSAEPHTFQLVRRGLTGDCTVAYIANKYSKYCKQKCPLNQTPQFG